MRAIPPFVATILSVAIGLQSMRVLFPLLYATRETRGVVPAMAVALLVFASPVLAPAMRRWVGGRCAIAMSLGALALAGLVMQFHHPIDLWVAATATAASLIAWTLSIHAVRSPQAGGGTGFALAFVAGMALDTGLHVAFGTWDPMWRRGVLAPAATTVLVLALVAAIPSAMRRADRQAVEVGVGGVITVAALGPFLVLQVLFWQNAAFVSSAAGIAPSTSGAALLAAQALGLMSVARWPHGWATRTTVVVGVAVVALVWIMVQGQRQALVIATVAASALAIPLVSMALSTGKGRTYPSAWRTSITLGASTTLFLACLFAYQIDATSPLPIPIGFVPVVAAVLLMIAAALHRGDHGPTSDGPPEPARRGAVIRRFVVVPITMLVLVSALARSSGSTGDDDANDTVPPGPVRVLDWNVHSSVDGLGQVDPAAIADTIEAHEADVVILHEVARGWPIAGTLDLASWLSHRLDMSFEWAPSADDQFGNVVLSRVPARWARVVSLPFGGGPQRRSAVIASLPTQGRDLTIVGAHLESGSPGTRAQQIEFLLSALEDRPCTIVAGDMNMQPVDEDDLSLFDSAGLVSAQDLAGDPAASTARDPGYSGDRPDWVFVTRDLEVVDFAIIASEASDHLPLVATVGPCPAG